MPTYERYIIGPGPIERFDRRRNAFMTLDADNPYGEDFRRRFKARTGYDHWKDPLPYRELEPEDRIGQSLAEAARRVCFEYEPPVLPVTAPEGRFEVADPGWMARFIKKVGLFLGADMVRITELDQRWVYQDIDIPHKYAIVIVVSHVRSLNNTAPSQFSWLSATDTYSRLKLIATQMADFIAGLGYDAAYRETLGHNPELLMVPLAIDAGVGEFARNARVMSPEYGVNMRLKAVTTDMPLQVDKPISFGAHEFCMACENCATYCPPRAIPFGPPTDEPVTLHNNPGYRKWYLDAEKCLTFWSVNKEKWLSCGGRCIAVCPWNHELNTLHNTVRWMAIRAPRGIKKLLVQMDRKLYQRDRRLTDYRDYRNRPGA
nr:reductive dehalogenase [uncultured prokaryote]